MGFWGSSFDPATEIPDLTGKVALVTGGNTGMGYTVVEHLALHGAKVYMAARTESKAKEAIAKFEHDHRTTKFKGQVIFVPLVLDALSSVVDSAKQILQQEARLDILVNNAGRMGSPYEMTPDGYEQSISANHLGHFILTMTLFPLLKSTAALPGSDVRVVTVSSGAHKFGKKISKLSTKEDLNTTYAADPASLNSFSAKQSRYAFTKILNILFASELQRYADAQKVPLVSMSLNPGVVATGGALDLWPAWFQPAVKYLTKTPLQGATTALFCAAADQVKENKDNYRGAYLDPPGKIVRASDTARDEALAKELWKLSDEIMKEVLSQKA